MPSLGNVAAKQEPLLLTDEQLHGEKLSIETDENRWPLRWSVLLVVTTNLILWLGIGVVIPSLF